MPNKDTNLNQENLFFKYKINGQNQENKTNQVV